MSPTQVVHVPLLYAALAAHLVQALANHWAGFQAHTSIPLEYYERPNANKKPRLGGFATLMLCFVLRFTQTAIAEIQVNTAIVAGLASVESFDPSNLIR